MSARRFIHSLIQPALAAVLLLAPLSIPARAPAQQPADETIRPFDKVTLKNGNSIVGTIETPGDPKLLIELEISTRGGTSRMRLKQEDIASIEPRWTADDAYKKLKRGLSAETEAEKRASAELHLGLWCQTPVPELDGAAPRPQSALTHLLNAVELAPTLTQAYPHILGYFSASEPGSAAATSSFDREARVALLADGGGFKDPEIDFRLGQFFAERANLPSRAKEHLERLLASGHKNAGQVRKARSLLRELYLRDGAPEKAIALYEAGLAADDSGPASFEPHYELGRLYSRGGGQEALKAAREHFTKAVTLQPEFLETSAELAALDYRSQAFAQAEKSLRAILVKDPGNVPVSVSLGLVLTKLAKYKPAEELLKGIAQQATGFDRARALLGLGLVREAKGDDLGAITNYREAFGIDGDLVEAKVAAAFGLLRAGQADEARSLAEGLLPLAKESPHIFAVCSRILGEVETAEGKLDSALAHFLRAVEVDANDPTLLERIGILYLRSGKLDAGFSMLLKVRQVGGERPDTLNGMAFYHYSRGEFDAAKKIFETVLGLVKAPPKPTGKDAKPLPIPSARLYALRGKEQIEDLGRLEMWSADLAGTDGSTLNGWQESERFGVDITRKDGRIVLSGKQAIAPDGVTAAMLDRPVEVSTFERVAVSAKVEAGKARIGLRLEGYARTGGAATGLIFYKDFDGTLRVQAKSASGDWEAVPVTEDIPPEGAKLVNPGTTVWPSDGAYHTIEIRRSGRPGTGAGTTSRVLGLFDLYLDGQPVAWNVKVTGIGGKTYELGISGQTDALGSEYTISAESFRVFREQPAKGKKAKF